MKTNENDYAIAEALHNEKTLSGYGRAQHGLNGKDADLHAGGQCAVDRLRIYHDKNGIWLEADFHQYATICPEEDDDNETRHQQLLDASQELAWEASGDFRGEWEGSAWIFSNPGLKARCPITPAEYANHARSGYFLARIAGRLLKAINANPAVPAFEKRMERLNQDLDSLQKKFPPVQ